MSDDPVRRRTADLARQLGRPALASPPPRLPATPISTDSLADPDGEPTDVPRDVAGEPPTTTSPPEKTSEVTVEPPPTPPASKASTSTEPIAERLTVADSTVATGPTLRARRREPGKRVRRSAASVGVAEPMTWSLTREAADLLAAARTDERGVRDVGLDAVRATVGELPRAAPPDDGRVGPHPLRAGSPPPAPRRVRGTGARAAVSAGA